MGLDSSHFFEGRSAGMITFEWITPARPAGRVQLDGRARSLSGERVRAASIGRTSATVSDLL